MANNKKFKNNYMALLISTTLILIYSSFSGVRAADSKQLKMTLGYFSASGKEIVIKNAIDLEKSFLAHGLNVKVYAIKAGTYTPESPIEWDFAVSNFVTVAAQMKNKAQVEPVFWTRDCYFEAEAYTAGGSVVPVTYATKKIALYGIGYKTPSLLRAIHDWGFSNAQLFFTSDPEQAVKALENKEVDLLISDSIHSLGSDSFAVALGNKDQKIFQRVASTNYKYPCKVLSVHTTLPKSVIDRFIKAVAVSKSPLLKRFDLVNQQDLKKMKSTLDWQQLKLIEDKIKPLTKK